MRAYAEIMDTKWKTRTHVRTSTPGEILQRCSLITTWACGLLAASYSPDRQPHAGAEYPLHQEESRGIYHHQACQRGAAGWHRGGLPQTATCNSNQTRSSYTPSMSLNLKWWCTLQYALWGGLSGCSSGARAGHLLITRLQIPVVSI